MKLARGDAAPTNKRNTTGGKTMRVLNYAAPLLFTVVTAFALVGCEREGPAEQAGETIDETMQDVQQSAEDVGEAMQEQAEQAGDKIEQATDQ
jgi:hyperosmotically inducible protein